MEQEKLAIDIFIKYSTNDLEKFKEVTNKGKFIMLKDIHLDDRFNPKKYVRYYITYRVLEMPDKKPLPQFNIVQKRIERIHNAAISIEMQQFQLDHLSKINKELFYYIEVGGVYVLDEGEEPNEKPWYSLQ